MFCQIGIDLREELAKRARSRSVVTKALTQNLGQTTAGIAQNSEHRRKLCDIGPREDTLDLLD